MTTDIRDDRHTADTPDDPAPEGEVGWERLVLIALGVVALGLAFGASVILIIVAFVVIIFLHEMGHYLTAKAAGMKVTEFFIGFGPKLWSFRRGETEYGLKGIPAGAYVRIVGMNNLEDVDPAEEARTYRQQPYWRRVSVAAGGPIMNLALALVLLFVLFAFVGVPDDEAWEVNGITEDSAADVAGLENRDRLLTIDGEDVTDWGALVEVIQERAGQDVEITYERDGEVLTTSTVVGERLTEAAADGLDGLLPGDILRSVDGRPVESYAEFVEQVEVGGTYTVEVVENRDIVTAEVTVEELVTTDATVGFLGIGQRSVTTTLPLGESLDRTFTTYPDFAWQTITGVTRLFTPGSLGDQLQGAVAPDSSDDPSVAVGDAGRQRAEGIDENRVISVVGGVRLGAQATQEGAEIVLLLFISLNMFLGVLNLLPLLPLDGGHIVVATYERIRELVRGGVGRYHADVTKLLPVTYAVIAVLVFIGLLAIWRDIVDPVNLQ